MKISNWEWLGWLTDLLFGQMEIRRRTRRRKIRNDKKAVDECAPEKRKIIFLIEFNRNNFSLISCLTIFFFSFFSFTPSCNARWFNHFPSNYDNENWRVSYIMELKPPHNVLPSHSFIFYLLRHSNTHTNTHTILIH